jgi:hypothetical protein
VLEALLWPGVAALPLVGTVEVLGVEAAAGGEGVGACLLAAALSLAFGFVDATVFSVSPDAFAAVAGGSILAAMAELAATVDFAVAPGEGWGVGFDIV